MEQLEGIFACMIQDKENEVEPQLMDIRKVTQEARKQ